MIRSVLVLCVCACAAAPPEAVDAGLEAWQQQLLDAHNSARAGAANPTPSPALPALTWSFDAQTVATTWANGCQFAHNANRGAYGENIYGSTNTSLPSTVVDSWTAEAASYDYATDACTDVNGCGHYTQVVWRKTTSVGCASRQCTTNSPFPGHSSWMIWVCDYAPAGNVVREKPY